MSRKRSTLSLSRANSDKESTTATATAAAFAKLPPHYDEEAMLTPEGLPPSLATSTSILVFPLHNAVQKGHLEEVVALLSIPGTNPFKQDFKGRTILHYAAIYGIQSTAVIMTKEILNCNAILTADNVNTQRCLLLGVQDINGETALHLAAKAEHRKIVQLFIFSAADVNIKSNDGKEPIEIIYEKVPQAMCALFDTAIHYRSGEIGEDSFDVLLDFGPIVGFPDEAEQEDPFAIVESELLAYSLKSSASKCKKVLMHPLVQLFLHFKWKKVRPLFWASILIHLIWLLIFSTFLLDLYLHSCPYLPQNATDTREKKANLSGTEEITSSDSENLSVYCAGDVMNFKLAWLASLISVVMGLKELYELNSSPTMSYYFSKLENLGQLLLILIVALTTLPVWVYLLGTGDSVTLHPWQYQAAAFGIFLAWTLILGQIGKTPRLGLYVEILFRVLKSFGLFVLTFTSLLTAFALSFSILMPQNETFSSWPKALLKVLVMMTGELNYDEVFYNSEDQPIPIRFRTTGHVLFALFVVIVTIILFNLLIGLTVSDIQGLQTGANVKLRASELEQIFLMESFLFSKLMERIFKLFRLNPKFLKNFQISAIEDDEMFGVIVPTRRIPKELQSEVKDLAMRNLNGDINPILKDDQEFDSNVATDNLKVIIRDVLLQVLQEHFPKKECLNGEK